jgi:putative membrane protein
MSDHEPESERRGLKDYLLLSARGFVMGAADVVPGVSGGTMAFILGIYEELINSIHAVDLKFIRRLLSFRFREAFADFPWRFLLALVIGIAAAVLTLAEGLDWALREVPHLVWAFFFGLVLASAIVVRRRVERWGPPTILAAFLAALFGYLLVGAVPMETPDAPWFLFLSGAIAINAMILPGISGAFIMVLLGKYHFLLQAVVNRDVVPLLIVIAGAAVGLLTFVRILRWLFRNYHDLTVAVLIGLIIGALRKVWPWKETVQINPDTRIENNILPAAFNVEVALALVLMLIGFFTVLLLDYLASRSTQRRSRAGEPEKQGQELM